MTGQPPPSYAPPPPGAPAARSGWKIALIVIGVIVAVVGAALAASGVALLALFGSDGTIDSGKHSVSTSSAALVSQTADLKDTTDTADVIGDPRIRISVSGNRAGAGVFVGIGPTPQVDRYLASAPIEEVTDFEVDPFKLVRKRRAGTKVPAAPASQSFWVAQGSGRQATLRWKVRDGDYRLVIMNADGSRGVDADGDVGITIPHTTTFGWVLIGLGLVLIAGGVIAIVLGARRPRAVS